MATQIILLERVDNLGEMGDVVSVKPGYARNYLLPEKKALRASKENIAYFEAQKKALEGENAKKKKEAEKQAEKLKGLTVPLIRQASESGQLFGSVSARDIAEQVKEASKVDVDRRMVRLNQNYKMLGLFPVEIAMHPEVTVEVTINIARSMEEAEIQEKTGKALVSEEKAVEEIVAEEQASEEQLEEVLEDSALQAEKEKAEQAKAEKAAAKQDEAENTEQEAGEDEKE